MSTTTWSSPLLAVRGAVAADGPDAGVPAHYGDPFTEQRSLARGSGAVDLSHRGVVTVTGPDRLGWLHSLTTQHLTELAPHTPTQALILSPHGHIEHDLHLVDDGETCWITVEPGTAADLVAFLDRMRFMLRVEVADVTEQWAVLWRPGTGNSGIWWARPEAPELLGEFAGHELLVARPELAAAMAIAAPAIVGGDGAGASGVEAFEALRIAAHIPRFGFETDHRTIPHELGLLAPAVHLQKGCYRGQETVARVHNLGRPPRRLVFLHLDGTDVALPAHGDPITLEDRQIGFVGSVARHHELGSIALGVIKRNTPVDAELLAGGILAAAEIVVEP
ncbi:MAG: CAF17-like 4Fe-4S cluster assembly/insertion protein YgfZ [Sporichthyaceae bacterium]